MLKRFDIFKTFDIFEQVSLSVIRETIIKLVFVETENFFANKPDLTLDLTKDNNAQITVINNKRVYNLLSSAMMRKEKLKEHENINC
ncbi:MAG: hypothetical protein WCK67_08115 [bacterium]